MIEPRAGLVSLMLTDIILIVVTCLAFIVVQAIAKAVDNL
ncbi:hypothetical protein COFA105466_11075 [Corynebacterium falsenii]